MAVFDNFPYTNTHEMNLDWIIKRTESVLKASDEIAANTLIAQESAENAAQSETAAALSAESAATSAEYVANLKSQVNTNTNNIAANTASIASIVSGTTPDANAELIDIRVWYNGDTSASAGDAVRGQVSNLYALTEKVISENLFNYNNCLQNTGLSANGSETTLNNHYVSEFIPAEAATLYLSCILYNNNVVYATTQRVCAYDSSKTFIAIVTNSNTGLTTPTGTAFLRFVFNASNNGNNIMVLKGNTYPSKYIPYFAPYYRLLPTSMENIDGALIQTSPLYGKNVAWYGDSIINNQWWLTLSTLFNMNSINNGTGGAKISGTAADALSGDTAINAISSSSDFIIIGAGTNDWANNVPLGNKNLQYDNNYNIVTDVTTFYQACHVMIRKLLNNYSNAKIIVLGTPFGKMANRSSFTNKYGLLNNENLTTLDYGNALCDIAEMYGLPALRYGNDMLINDINCSLYLDTNSQTDHLHPNTEAGKDLFRRCTYNHLLNIRQI